MTLKSQSVGALCEDGVTQSDPTFDAGFGSCETYVEGEFNHAYCEGDGADVACPVECGTCPTCFDEPDFDIGWGTCDTYAPGGVNDGYCVDDGADTSCPVSCGTCPVDAAAPQTGDVIFTEFMPNPDENTDASGEWFEVYNVTDKPLELSGVVLSDLSSSEVVSPDQSLVIEAGSYLVFAKSDGYGGEVPPAWVFSTISLNNGGDTIGLNLDETTVIDSVNYTGGAYAAGVAMQLSTDGYDATSNDDVEWWCAADTDQGNGDLGTPGLANTSCWV